MTTKSREPHIEIVTGTPPVRKPSLRDLLRWKRLKALILQALGQDEPAERLALSFAVGNFCAMLPFPGHTFAIAGVAFAFRLNMTASIAGAWMNVPPLLPFTYGLAFFVGTLVTGVALPDIAAVELTNATTLWTMFRTYFYPLTVGTTIVGLVWAFVGYFVALHIARLRPAAKDNAANSEPDDEGEQDVRRVAHGG